MLQEKIQKKHDTQKKRTFEAYEAVQKEIDDKNKKSRRETEAPIQFASSKKIAATQKGKKQQRQTSSVEFLTFHERIRCLRDFKQKYGHVNVPRSHGVLGTWCSIMRSIKAGTCKRYKHPDFKLTKKRMKVLEEMGFRWTTPPTSPAFNEYFQDLQAYKEKHGHCYVPKEYKEHKKLGHWCAKIRLMKSGTQPNTGI